MKGKSRILAFGAAAALMAVILATAVAETVILSWDPSPSTGIGCYRAYYGMKSRSYAFVTNTGLAVRQVLELPDSGRWFFAVTACGTNGMESAFSSEVMWDSKPEPPAIHGSSFVRITPVIERSTNLVSWSAVLGEPTLFAATNAAEFFRASRLTIESVNLVK